MNGILITGGAGFIGSHVVDMLLAQGNRVICIDDFNGFYSPNLKRKNISEHLNSPLFTLVEGDITNNSLVKTTFEQYRPDAVIHLAARAGVRPSLLEPYLYENVNVRGTLNLLEACKENPVRKFVFASSSSVYGLNNRVPFKETDALTSPASPYAATKIAGEALCNTYSHLYGISVVALRFFTVFGPRQRPDLAIRKFTQKILADETIELYGDGTTSRDYTYISDIVNGILSALLYEGKPYEVFNLGNSRPVKLIELVAEIEKAVGLKARVEYKPDQAGDVPTTYADILLARQKLNYDPRTGLEEGIYCFTQWMKNEINSINATPNGRSGVN